MGVIARDFEETQRQLQAALESDPSLADAHPNCWQTADDAQ
jgi:hypothetical protein